MDSAEEMRAWAVEQVVKHHGGTGVTLEAVIAEAKKLIEYVRPTPEVASK